jgi:fumarylacetoacetase
MTAHIDHTHAVDLQSWVESANLADSDFPIQSLPYGVFRSDGEDTARIGAAIGDRVLDLAACQAAGLLDGLATASACTRPVLNDLMAVPAPDRKALRHRLVELLEAGASDEIRAQVEQSLLLSADVEMLLPAEIGDYADFYASVHHATNVGSMMRPDNPLLPNYKYVVIGYHGRASSIVVSGTQVKRPSGQRKAVDADAPDFGPSRLLDYELEVGMFVGPGNALGEPVSMADAEDQLFGLCLVNDWSARDVQVWEYQPLGPFLGKSFATSVSPWIVTLDALAPFRCAAYKRPDGDPQPLAHLDSEKNRAGGGIDLTLEVWIQSRRMREEGFEPVRLSRGRFSDLYWTVAQMIAHHTSNGCNLRPGDLLASGTVSGPDKSSRGCLLELSWRGTEPIELPTGEELKFLQDGDELFIRGFCEREGFARVGFGECHGIILPAD